MESIMWIESIGITATLLVLLSFLMKKATTIRLINIFGAIMFIVYGILIHSLSTWLLNGALIVIHIYFLIKYRKEQK